MARHLIGVVAFAVTFGALGLSLGQLRRSLLPSWTGSAAALVDVTAFAVIIVGVTQVLGLASLYRWWAVIPAYLLVAVLAGVWARRTSDESDNADQQGNSLDDSASAESSKSGTRIRAIVGAVGLGIGLGPWIVRAAEALTGGVPGADTLWYHLPSAMRLVQTGSSRSIAHFDPGNLTAFFPQASTYFHATGMLFLGSDILSPVVNLGWAAVALLAGWVIGRPRGISPATMFATAVAISFPGFVGHQGGSAMNDIVVLALIFAALALLLNARSDGLTTSAPILAIAAAATGVALGTKWTALPAAAAVTIAVLAIVDAGHRVRTAGIWLASSGFFGLMTYGRNWLAVGNPLPARDIVLGPLSFEAVVPPEDGTGSIAEWIFDDAAWNGVFGPGLRLWFGPLWVPVLVALVAGLVGVLIVGGGRLYRVLAFVGLASLIGYLVSPQNLVFFGLPQFFVSNLRYAGVAIGLGLVSIPLLLSAPRVARSADDDQLVLGSALLLAPIALSSVLVTRTWTGVDDWRYQEFVGRSDTVIGLIGAAVIVVAALAVGLNREQLHRHARPLVGGVVAIGLLAFAFGQPAYLDRRYARDPFLSPARTLTDARIALDGVNTQFQLSGPDLSNHIQWVGRIDDDVFAVVTSCTEWIGLINEGRYTHAFFGSTPAVRSGPYAWATADPNATLLSDFSPDEEFSTAFFALVGPLDPTGCTS